MQFPPLVDLRSKKLAARRQLLFTMNGMTHNSMSMSPMPGMSLPIWDINNKAFNDSRVDITSYVGSTELWEIINLDSEFHNFHIHQLHFQVIAINGQLQPFVGYQDTVLIDYAQPGLGFSGGSVVVLISFEDPTVIGTFVYHCHVMLHEDNGMMGLIVVKNAASASDKPHAVLLLASMAFVLLLHRLLLFIGGK